MAVKQKPAASGARRQVSIDDLLVTDEEPPPVQRGRGARSEWDNIIDALAQKPGKWGKVNDVSSSTSSNLKKRAKNGLTPPIEVRMADIDQKTGRGTLWLRVVKAD
jgi:hypothetical protein